MKIIGEFTLLRTLVPIFVLIALSHAKVDEQKGRKYANEMDAALLKAVHAEILAVWNYESNITDYNAEKLNQAVYSFTEENKKYRCKAKTYPWQNYTDATLKRIYQKYTNLGWTALSDNEYGQYIDATNNMIGTFYGATICNYHDKKQCDLVLDPEITSIFETSSDPDELKYTWVEWHKAAGAPSRNNFTNYVKVDNEAAKLNGFKSVAEWWLDAYEMKNEDQFVALWAKIKPLYQQIHAYVRRILRKQYGEKVVSAKGPIPAHLLGSVWAQQWDHFAAFTLPYPEKSNPNITAALYSQNYTSVKMFKTAEKFFVSLNLTAMPKTFWKKSIFEKPEDGRDIMCTASSWDFYDSADFRVRQCTEVTEEFFENSHFQMANVEYFLQYKNQPYIFRDQANPAFFNSFGEAIVLSVTSPKHYKALGFIEDGNVDQKTTINHLYTKSLQRVVLLPFAYLLDLFRYGVFRGTTTPDDYNCHYWQFRESIQGIEPPVARTEKDFDPAAKYQVSGDEEYMNLYVSNILQFQFHEAMCKLAGQYKTGNYSSLSNCDITKSTAAGNALKKMLELGSSQSPSVALEALTGTKNIDAQGVLDYFQPLYEWLKAENEKNGEFIGWKASKITFCTAEQRSRMKSSGFNDRMKKYSGS